MQTSTSYNLIQRVFLCLGMRIKSRHRRQSGEIRLIFGGNLSMKRILALALTSVLLVSTACSSGKKSESTDPQLSGPARALYQPPGVVGPDSFAPTFELSSYEVTSDDPVLEGEVSSSAPGIYRGQTYGGTGTNICDTEKMIEFLQYYSDRGRAWAAIQGISFEELPSFIRSLTSVYVTQDINVKMFGFKNGQSYGYDAVIAAGTAILIDDQGMPRARCACGNPLLSPNEEKVEATETSDSTTQETTPQSTPDDTVTTQESTTIPGEVSIPTDDSIPPVDEPQCPEQIIGGGWTDYIDANGDRWTFITTAGQWVNVDDESVSPVDEVGDLPGFKDACGEPRNRKPQTECPETFEGARYTDPEGNVWVWVSDDTDGAHWWFDDNGKFVYLTTSDLPGIDADCDDPEITITGECPETFQGARYTDSEGTTWIWTSAESTGAHWMRIVDGVVDISEARATNKLAGVPEDCPEESPCPPTKPRIGDVWYDAQGSLWEFNYREDSTPSWDNTSTEEVESVATAQLDAGADCPPPPTQNDPCPPTKPHLGSTWTAPDSSEWVYGQSPSGTYGWDMIGTEDFENLTNDELGTEDCYPPVDPPCPEIKASTGDSWVAPNGDVFVYNGPENGWVNANEPDIHYMMTIQLPGYIDECMPPCPPLQVSIDENAVWVDPTTQDIWIWRSVEWINLTDSSSVATTVELPWYRSLCLPPCPPDSAGENIASWTSSDNDLPVTNSLVQSTTRSAITIQPGIPTIERIADNRVRATVAPYDDCNEEGCVDLNVEPEDGHTFVDNRGVRWVYGGDGIWYSEQGESATYVYDIPGYRDACDDPEEPVPFECPQEFEGNTYTESTGTAWIWVWFNNDAADTDHGQHWYTRYEDGSTEYRTTADLEADGRFANCTGGGTIAEGEIKIGVEPKDPVCAETDMFVRITATSLTGSAVTTMTATFDGSEIPLILGADGAWTGVAGTIDPGNQVVEASATAADGSTGTASTDAVVRDCDQPSSDETPTTTVATATTTTVADPKGPGATTTVPTTKAPGGTTNQPPAITISVAECVEIGSDGPTVIKYSVGASDPEGAALSGRVLWDGGKILDLAFAGSGSSGGQINVTYTFRGQSKTLKAEISDGANSRSASVVVRGVTPGGCSQSTAPTTTPNTSTPAVAPTTTTTVVAPNTTQPVVTNQPPSITFVALQCGANSKAATFNIVDPEGALGDISVKVGGVVRTNGASFKAPIYSIPITSNDAGKVISINAFDIAKNQTVFNYTLPKGFCG